jgi:pilus assembly protein CpaE
MDTVTLEAADFDIRTATAIEPVLRIAAGRLPMMAFVDGPTEQVLQECAVLLGRNQIIRGGIAKAVEYLSEQRSPNLLLVDISGVELPLSRVQMLADVCEPGTNVIAVGDHNDVALYRDLQAAGVTDYLVKPLTRELLTRALTPKTNSGEMGKATATLKLGKMVAFVGARGGVGTTTLAANLAWHLANQQHRRVALVDLDLQQGDCSLLVNVDTTPGLRDALANPLRLDPLLLDRLMSKHGERLFILGGEEPIQDHVQFTPAAVDTLFSVLRSQFHYVVVDVPRIPIPAYRRALEIADRRVIVVDQTMRSMRDAVRLKNTFADTGAEQAIFVLNREGEAGSHGLNEKEIIGVLQANPTSTIPFLPKLVTPAAHHATIAARQRKFGNAVGKLALEISGRTRKRRWFSRRG